MGSVMGSRSGRHYLIAAVLGGLCAPSFFLLAQSPDPRIAGAEKGKLSSERFVEVDDAHAFSEGCKAVFTAMIREDAFSLASPREPYQATDAISLGPRLPWRRLIVGGQTADRCVIYYEKGGLTTTRQVVVIDTTKSGSPVITWRGIDGSSPRNIAELAEQMGAGKFRAGEAYGW